MPQHTTYERNGLRLEDEVYSQLLADIRQGAYALGERLPSEMELAAARGVSRPVIRAALARLREDGLIVSKQGAGSFVSTGTPADAEGYAPLDSVADIAAYFRFRAMIEMESVRLAATRITPAGIKDLRDLIGEMEQQVAGGIATIEPDLAFHRRIAQLSDNRFVLATIQMLEPQVVFIGKFVRSLGRTGYRKGKQAMSVEHHAIVDALEARDPEAAARAMEAHIAGSEHRVFKGEG